MNSRSGKPAIAVKLKKMQTMMAATKFIHPMANPKSSKEQQNKHFSTRNIEKVFVNF